MKDSVICKKNICFGLYTVLTTILLSMGHIFSDVNRIAAGFALVFVAIVLYFYVVFFVAEKNWLDIRAVFHVVWVATIGLAALRLTDYQEKWQVKTWYYVALAYLVFQIGAHFGITLGKPLFEKTKNLGNKFKSRKIRFEVKEERFFGICIITTLVGMVCFLINVMIRGYVPCFSDDPASYVNFYTKFHVFAVASTGVSGLCYYCMATQKISKIKKVILALCILYMTFIFPILVVSRGTFVVSALALTVTAYYIHKKKFLVLVACVSLIAGIYLGTSFLRGYADAQLQELLEPSEIHLNIKEPSSSQKPSDKDNYEESSSELDKQPENEDDYPENEEEFSEDGVSSVISFSLPPKLTFVYSYLTVSHDNFNEAVQNSKECTYGLHQIAPFNTILRSARIDRQISKAEYFLVRPHLNTINLIGYFYYDFHIWGVVLFTLLWSFIFGVLQKFAELDKKPFFLLALGNAMAPVALCFFAAWLSVFSQWMLWGVVLIFALASSVNVEFKNKKESKKNAEG